MTVWNSSDQNLYQHHLHNPFENLSKYIATVCQIDRTNWFNVEKMTIIQRFEKKSGINGMKIRQRHFNGEMQ